MEKKKQDQNELFPNESLSQRKFMGALGAASAGIALGTACSKDSKDPVGPDPSDNDPGPGAPEVAVGEIRMYDYNVLKQTMTDMIDKLGGFSDLISNGDTVGIKVNLTGGNGNADRWQRTTGVSAIESYWTHPQVTNVIGELAKDAGASKIYIIESIYDWDSFNKHGFNQIAAKLGAQLVNTNETEPYSDYVVRPVGGSWQIYRSIFQNGIFEELDCFISLPKAKQHVSAGVTHAMKNLVGTLPQPRYQQNGSGNRAAIHNHGTQHDKNKNSNLCRVVLDINQATKINLAVNDAIKTTIGGEGPWCNTMANRTFNKLIISKDVVAADAISTQVIGFDPTAADGTNTFALPNVPCINYLKKAEELGLGVHDPEKIKVIQV